MGAKRILKATHEGDLEIGDLVLPCAVLSTGQRVLTQRGVHSSLGMPKQAGGRKTGGGNLPTFLAPNNLKPFISEELVVAADPLIFHPLHGGRTAYGYPAELLPQICKVYLDARKKGILTPAQMRIAERCETLIQGFAIVGIVALVDEATGYQDERAKDALRKILEAFIAEELRPWMKTFNDQFYKQIFRLNNWPYTEDSITIKRRPPVVGRWTNDIVYDRLAPGVRQALHEKAKRDEKGRLKYHLHRWLSDDIGQPKLREHLAGVTALLTAANSWDGFKRSLERVYPKFPQETLPKPKARKKAVRRIKKKE